MLFNTVAASLALFCAAAPAVLAGPIPDAAEASSKSVEAHKSAHHTKAPAAHHTKAPSKGHKKKEKHHSKVHSVKHSKREEAAEATAEASHSETHTHKTKHHKAKKTKHVATKSHSKHHSKHHKSVETHHTKHHSEHSEHTSHITVTVTTEGPTKAAGSSHHAEPTKHAETHKATGEPTKHAETHKPTGEATKHAETHKPTASGHTVHPAATPAPKPHNGTIPVPTNGTAHANATAPYKVHLKATNSSGLAHATLEHSEAGEGFNLTAKMGVYTYHPASKYFYVNGMVLALEGAKVVARNETKGEGVLVCEIGKVVKRDDGEQEVDVEIVERDAEAEAIAVEVKEEKAKGAKAKGHKVSCVAKGQKEGKFGVAKDGEKEYLTLAAEGGIEIEAVDL